MKVYVIIQGEGEYSDRTTFPAKVYRDKKKAQDIMHDLEKIQCSVKPYYHKRHKDVGGWDAFIRAINSANVQYLKLGFDQCTDALWYDWELYEVEFIQ